MFIVIEGCDRFGKSTQVDMLVAKLRRCGLAVSCFTFPYYESETGQIIDKHLHNDLCLQKKTPLAFERSEHDALVFQCVQTCNKYELATKILSRLRKGDAVICGRWWQSAYIYGLDDGIDRQWLLDVHDCLPRADLNILLDFSPDEAAKRFTIPGDRYEADLPKQRRLRDLYRRLWETNASADEAKGRDWIVLPADGTIDEVHSRIVAGIKQRFFPHADADYLR